MRKDHYTKADQSLAVLKVVFVLGLCLAALPGKAEENQGGPFFTWDLLWAGSWTRSFGIPENDFSPELVFSGGTLANRGQFRFGFPRQDLIFRVQGIDKRIIPDEGLSQPFPLNPGFGLYFGGAGGKFLGNSRLLYGVLDEYGLPARIRNVWAKSVPYAEYRKPTMRDLKTEASTRDPEAYLYLSLPPWGFFTGFASIQTGTDLNPAFGGGFDIRPDNGMNFRLEGFYIRKVLETRKPAAWFSLSPALPERDFRLFGLGTSLDFRNFGFAGDFAFSETFAWGRDIYGNAAFRIGNKPWKFSLAADAGGSRYTGPDGNAPGPGFRMAGRLERRWARSGLFRFNTVFHSPFWGETFEQSSTSLYFRPSAPRGRQAPLFRFTRASLTLERDASAPKKIKDSLGILTGFNVFTLRTAFSASLYGRPAFDTEQKPFPFPIPPCFEDLESVRFGTELGWSMQALQLRFKAGYTAREKKEPLWDFSLNSSLKTGKFGRVSLKIASPDFPDKWTYAFSWRLAMVSW